ncbi:MAG TPA: hypothetical protein VKK31_16180 [Thermoanaerobaculia bacterium]|nr:hypothetical protein [Thermoanaerobaculia bacterium]
MNRNTLLLTSLLLSLCACGDRNAAAPTASEEPPATESTAADVAAESQPSGDSAPGTISSRGGGVPEAMPPAAEQTAGEGSIDFDLPQSWQSQAPSSSMRVAQAAIPGAGGPGELAVFFFGPGGGGGVEANIQRWIDQMESPEQPKPETFEANGFKVTWIDVQGTLKPSTMGSGPTTPQPSSRLLGAVVEGPGGPWFFKATGPEATLGPEREAFVKMLKSVRAKSQSV